MTEDAARGRDDPARRSRRDYGRVIGRVNAWWGGRDMAPMLPKLFFLHFEGTSFVADDDEGQLAGFLVRLPLADRSATRRTSTSSASRRSERGSGLGRELYERFFDGRAGARARASFAASPRP